MVTRHEENDAHDDGCDSDYKQTVREKPGSGAGFVRPWLRAEHVHRQPRSVRNDADKSKSSLRRGPNERFALIRPRSLKAHQVHVACLLAEIRSCRYLPVLVAISEDGHARHLWGA